MIKQKSSKMGLSWFSSSPLISCRYFHPGLRHPSRLNVKPKPFVRQTDFYQDAQLKIGRNTYDAHTQLLMQLVDAKNIFSKQLPNMGSGYIARLVFDIYAETIMILHNGRFIGGICSRLFEEQNFVEIVFCAVDSTYQAKGYGRLAMNFLKTLLQVHEIYDMLTCADNEAVIYFRKQGFNSKEILMNPKRWIGYIKDYEGITLVHCKIYPDIDYFNFNEILKNQMKLIENKLNIKFNNIQFKELMPKFIPYKQQPSIVSISIPKILLLTNNFKKNQKDYFNKVNLIKNKLLNILEILKKDEKFGSTFLRPVTEEIAPAYFNQINKPMDFYTIEKRLLRFSDYYKKPILFALDIQLIVNNCQKYNLSETIYFKQATELLKKFKLLYIENFPEYPLPDFI